MHSGKTKIKSGDNVIILAGKDKGKTGEVISVDRKKNRAIIKGLNMVKKHMKPSAQNPQGGVKEMEAPIHISNIAFYDIESKTGTKIGYRFEDNKKVRFAKKSDKTLS